MAKGVRAVGPRPSPPSSDGAASSAQIALPAEAFALARLFERIPSAVVECEPAVANATDHALMTVHADSGRAAVETELEAARGVGTVEFLADRDDGWAYRVTWDGRPRRLVRDLLAAGVTIRSMWGEDGQWRLKLLADDRAGIARANELMTDLDCGAEYLRIGTLDGETTDAGLTSEQSEALRTAFEMGYYDIPRDVTAKEVADELGISHQALSERLRRAYRHLVGNELAANSPEPEEHTG